MNILDLQKRRLVDQWLADDHILVHLDSSKEAVRLPLSFKNNPGLTLKLSRLFNGAVELQEEGILTQLKFSGEYFDCFISWDALWGVTSEKGERKIWENSMPNVFLKNDESISKSESVEAENTLTKQGSSDKRQAMLKRIK